MKIWLWMVAVIAFVLVLATAVAANAKDYSEYECQEYAKALDANEPVIVVLTAKWCGACRSLKARYAEYGIHAVLVDIDDFPKTSALFKHNQIPQTYIVTREHYVRHVRITIEDLP